MSFLRRISSRQLLALCATVVALMAGAAALALAATGGGPKPAPASLPVAAHDALTAPEVSGVSARIQFTNHLIAGSSIQGADPILSGASGRLWASPDGKVRLELQASGHEGATSDSQVLINGDQFSIYDSGSNTVYKGTLPQHGPNGRDAGKSGAEQPPSLAEVKKAIASLMVHASVGGATPSDVAGRPAYTVKIGPKQDGGLIGGAELAWDAVHGTPLRAAVYAKGDSSPVLELKATDISYGPVASSVFDVTPPAGATVTDISPPANSSADNGDGKKPTQVTGLDAVQRQASFPVTAPPNLAGQAQNEVRLIQSGKDAGALVTYG
ncbi:MAG: outer rane lipoprotein carrier protein LolA, partial [Solirubrobacterales bacterium]|nr:outer rane lipoprotein carrier protein LolA [Solirubrobacterales bacterium]